MLAIVLGNWKRQQKKKCKKSLSFELPFESRPSALGPPELQLHFEAEALQRFFLVSNTQRTRREEDKVGAATKAA